MGYWTTNMDLEHYLVVATGAEINEVPKKSWNVKFTDVSGSGTSS